MDELERLKYTVESIKAVLLEEAQNYKRWKVERMAEDEG